MAAAPAPGTWPCSAPGCTRAYGSRKALNKHRREKHGVQLPVRPDRGACGFVAASLVRIDGRICPGCQRRYASRALLKRHLSGRYRRPPTTRFQPLDRVRPPPGLPLRSRVHEAARPQRARWLHLALRPAAPGSAEVEVSLPVRLVGLRTARRQAAALSRTVSVERNGLSLNVLTDAPAVALQGDVLLLAKSCRVDGKLVPTFFEIGCGEDVEVASAWTEPENVLEAALGVLPA